MFLNLRQIDKIRQKGFRPQVVGCILNNKKLLFVYKKKYKLWQLPQGGIDNGENIEQAINREMTEELGKNFGKVLKINSVIGENQLIFSRNNQGSRKLKTDAGTNIFMLGKKYFFVVINTTIAKLNINQTEFDDYRWVDYQEILSIIKTIRQKQKQEMTAEIVNLLHENNLL
jgi:putative (di)nucleoside polyphosphate hydrolase